MLSETLLAHEQLVRIGAFILMFATMATWEVFAPRRALTLPKTQRWANNLALLVINSIIVRALFPVAAVGFAVFAETHSMGVLNIWRLPTVVAIVAAVLIMDLAIYLQHIIFHALPVLWRLHRVHHADLDFDVTTGTRFHPIEILLSLGIKFVVIICLGPPAIAVLIFETLLNVTAMFNHSNIRLPNMLEELLRRLLVTPDMHRIHHSVDSSETNSNFGFCFSIWDWLLGTYRSTPRLGQVAMKIGMMELRDPRDVENLRGMLLIPFSPRSD
jgi:sterol desaturase/sphingolipid hydroxylase (fatty acid hydroxylase superfamily)